LSRTDRILQRLLQLHPNRLIDLRLDRIERLLDELDRPQDRLPPVIHVAGTNGKGSTIAFLRAFLEAAGQRVHVYTSPHLVAFRERIRLGGSLVSGRRLNAALECCEAINAGRPITYFEITTAAAFLLFAEEPADVLLLEVGLGGRFDATNVIDRPRGTVITPVSLDHIEFLGPDTAIIAREKAGILKRGAPAVIGLQGDQALAAITAEAGRLGVEPLIQGQDFGAHEERGRLVYQDGSGLLDLPRPRLHGPFQFDNAALAIAAARHFDLPVTEAHIATGLGRVDWPGRLMPLPSGRLRDLLAPDQELWLDGGHNEAGGAVLAAALRDMGRDRRPLVLVMGAFANKDARGYLAHFASAPAQVYAIRIPGDRASWTARQLADLASGLGLAARPMRSLPAALKAAALHARSRIVICGSLHLAGHVLALNGTPPA